VNGEPLTILGPYVSRRRSNFHSAGAVRYSSPLFAVVCDLNNNMSVPQLPFLLPVTKKPC